MSTHFAVRTTARRWLAVGAAVAAGALMSAPSAHAVPNVTTTVTADTSGSQVREWFNTAFDTQPRFFGKVRGRVRFQTETIARLDSTRALTSADRGEIDAGQNVVTRIDNTSVSSRLRVTARPTLQMLVEWQPRDDAYVCNNTNFPTFTGDDWFVRTDGGGNVSDGFCGAIEITADDLNTIALDLELPEVFALLDRQFNPGYSGVRTLSQSSQILEIKVCKIITQVFEVGIGDHCDLQLNAETDVPVTTVGQTLDAQLCTDGQLDGQSFSCVGTVGAKRSLTFTDPSETFTTRAPCPSSARDLDVRITNPAFDARVDAVNIGLSADFNIHLRRDGDGTDLLTVPVPGSISLLTAPIPLHVGFPARTLHVGDVTPDDDPPLAVLNPSNVTIDEGSSTTLTPLTTDLCSSPDQLLSTWAIDGETLTAPSLNRSYADDKPTALHSGTLVVADELGNASPAVPFGITVRNVAPTVGLDVPTEPFAVGTQAAFGSKVTDPGADLISWQWDFGDGSSAGRTASTVQDRADHRSHAYAHPGLHTVRLGVADGTDQRTASATVIAFDPFDRLVGSATFTADGSSIGVPVGSSYTVSSKVSYPSGAVRPGGTFTATFQRTTSAGQPESARLEASSYEWLFERGLGARLQGFGTVNGEAGWKFLAELTRDARDPRSARITVAVWRPGVTTEANPDYRFGGPRDTGNLTRSGG